jgi:hypothetical protein
MRFLSTILSPLSLRLKHTMTVFVIHNRIYVQYNYPEITFGTRREIRRCWIVKVVLAATYGIQLCATFHEVYKINLYLGFLFIRVFLSEMFYRIFVAFCTGMLCRSLLAIIFKILYFYIGEHLYYVLKYCLLR